MLNTALKVFGFFILCAGIVYGHGGRTDSAGGHTNKKTGEYHCHKAPCFSNHQKTDNAVQKKILNSTKYNRNDWPHWVDFDGDCQNARAEALIEASTIPVQFKRIKGCVVSHGRWFDPYTGNTYTEASKLDIDHIIPLKESHVSGGDIWGREQRRIFANDPENLIVVSAGENREKGAKDPAQWLPYTVSYRCEYVRRWVYVKRKYKLTMDAQEANTIHFLLASCKK